jgi:(p)ppGpp synthase/HD superfamily hydrolase
MPSPGIDAAAARSPLVRQALAKASEAHADQIRNGSGGRPYIEHPVAVAELLVETVDCDDEVLAAALLHDVVEDSATTVAELRESFGERVGTLVATLSDDESIADYRERKREHRGRVAAADGDALAIYGADKLTNARTLRRAFAAEGPAVAAEFKVPLELKVETWSADSVLLRELAPKLLFLSELESELTLLAGDLAAAAPRLGT